MSNTTTAAAAYASSTYRRHSPSHISDQLSKEEYQLSYGLDSSIAATHGGAECTTTRYGLMEDSYYEEDVLNGVANAGGALGRRRGSGYALTDTDYSSGISSTTSTTTAAESSQHCCTSSGGAAAAAARKSSSSGPTHRAQFMFVPRHTDEILLEVGDPLRVERECEDHWCLGEEACSIKQRFLYLG